MDVLEAIKNRRSCRSYLQKAVEFDKITAIIEAGHYAPSAGNLQDWKFVIVTDKGLRESIAEHCLEQFWMAHAPAYIVVCSNEERTEQSNLQAKEDLRKRLESLLEEARYADVQLILREMEPEDIAEILGDFSVDDKLRIFNFLEQCWPL